MRRGSLPFGMGEGEGADESLCISIAVSHNYRQERLPLSHHRNFGVDIAFSTVEFFLWFPDEDVLEGCGEGVQFRVR